MEDEPDKITKKHIAMAEIISIIISDILLYTWNTYYSKNNSIYGKLVKNTTNKYV